MPELMLYEICDNWMGSMYSEMLSQIGESGLYKGMIICIKY